MHRRAASDINMLAQVHTQNLTAAPTNVTNSASVVGHGSDLAHCMQALMHTTDLAKIVNTAGLCMLYIIL